MATSHSSDIHRSAIPKYLERYAEADIHHLPTALQVHQFEYVLVIPCYRENSSFVQSLRDSLLSQHDCLLILIINQPDNASGTDGCNTELWQHLLESTRPGESFGNKSGDQVFIAPYGHNKSSALLIVDRFTKGRTIPSRQGVGLARKIGADIALSLIAKKRIRQPWIWSSDADAHLPDDYFSAVFTHRNLNDKQSRQPTGAACVYPFRHTSSATGTDRVCAATRLYEQSLNHYVTGLRWAGSPYAYHTLGSALTVNAEHYAQVRGFPKRSGAEDFYLLNKLAKTGEITTLQSSAIEIESRLSDRVPFGTGPAVQKLLAQSDLSEARLFYDPNIFKELKTFLAALPAFFENPSFEDAVKELNIENNTRASLLEINLAAAIAHARKQSKEQSQFCRQMHIWFDAFRTLKFIHLLREKTYPNLTLADTKNAPYMPENKPPDT